MSGFDKDTSIDLINTTIMNANEEIFATLDIIIIDLYNGKIEFIKNTNILETFMPAVLEILEANNSLEGIDIDEFKTRFDMNDREFNKCIDILKEKYNAESGINIITYKKLSIS